MSWSLLLTLLGQVGDPTPTLAQPNVDAQAPAHPGFIQPGFAQQGFTQPDFNQSNRFPALQALPLRLEEPTPARAQPSEGGDPSRFTLPNQTAPLSLPDSSRNGGSLGFSPAEFSPEGRAPAATRLPTFPDGARDVPAGSNTAELEKLAEALLKDCLPKIAASEPGVAPLSLAQALERVTDRGRQTAIVKSYWLLALGWADVQCASQEVEFLTRLGAPATALDEARLRAAITEAEARRQQAELAYLTAQEDLFEVVPLEATPARYPSDAPFIGAYRTNFNKLFAAQAAPAALKRIDRTLPALRALIHARAAALASARDRLLLNQDQHQRRAVSTDQVVQALLDMREQRLAFLAAVRDYNLAIADYALNVANVNVNTATLVGMLIETGPRDQSVLANRSKNGALQPNGAATGYREAPPRPLESVKSAPLLAPPGSAN